MRFTVNIALAGLLALSQTLWPVHAAPALSTEPEDDIVSARSIQIAHVNDVHSLRIKRTPADDVDWDRALQVNNPVGLELTFQAWIPEQADSNWNRDTIAQFAKAGYAEVYKRRGEYEPYVVAALWIRGKGVAIGTQVRGLDIASHTAERFMDSLLPTDAPVLWELVKNRRVVGTIGADPRTAKWHAEDTAMWRASREMSTTATPINGGRFPTSLMVVYGRYFRGDPASYKNACSSHDNQHLSSRLIPGCERVLNDAGIPFYKPNYA